MRRTYENEDEYRVAARRFRFRFAVVAVALVTLAITVVGTLRQWTYQDCGDKRPGNVARATWYCENEPFTSLGW